MKYDVLGTGRPVLFLHGIPTTGRLWDQVIRRVKARFTCVVVDLPGMGESAPLADGSLDPARYAEELESLRQRLGFPTWDVVGHDAGSTIAVHYAARFGHRLNRLVLCSPPIFPEFRIPWFFRIVRIRLLGDCIAPFVTSVLLPIGFRLQLERHDQASIEVIRAFGQAYRGYRGTRRLVYILRWGSPARVLGKTAAMLEKISVPTLVLHGKYDRAIPISFAIRAASVIPQAQVRILDCGHFIPLNRPEAFCVHALGFLDARWMPTA
jgi:pimeloyl-ACP methyl ester carboxylesterase